MLQLRRCCITFTLLSLIWIIPCLLVGKDDKLVLLIINNLNKSIISESSILIEQTSRRATSSSLNIINLDNDNASNTTTTIIVNNNRLRRKQQQQQQQQQKQQILPLLQEHDSLPVLPLIIIQTQISLPPVPNATNYQERVDYYSNQLNDLDHSIVNNTEKQVASTTAFTTMNIHPPLLTWILVEKEKKRRREHISIIHSSDRKKNTQIQQIQNQNRSKTTTTTSLSTIRGGRRRRNNRRQQQQQSQDRKSISFGRHGPFFRVSRLGHQDKTTMAWRKEWDSIIVRDQIGEKENTSKIRIKPNIDYTNSDREKDNNVIYEYPKKEYVPPFNGGYPKLESLEDIFHRWPQDSDLYDNNDNDNNNHSRTNNDDNNDNNNHKTIGDKTFYETLQHFDYNIKKDREAALLYRSKHLPFKIIHVPVLLNAKTKWENDTYISKQFDDLSLKYKRPNGKCQESRTNFFSFFNSKTWNIVSSNNNNNDDDSNSNSNYNDALLNNINSYDMGLPPTRNNDYTFEEFSNHAKYADYIKLHPFQPHFYYQAFTDKEEKYINTNEKQSSDETKKSFISRDLYPEFSTSLQKTFLIPNPEQVTNSNIQCRFGERGIVSAIHYDVGDNLIGIIYGAKRYILVPPNQCTNLQSIITNIDHPLHRHSPINFGNLKKYNHINNASIMPSNNEDEEEQQQQQQQQYNNRNIEQNLLNTISSNSYGIETILKSGEVLFLPSYWFHYIIGLQKNSQCNVRLHNHSTNTNNGEDDDDDDEEDEGNENENENFEFGGRIDVSSERC